MKPKRPSLLKVLDNDLTCSLNVLTPVVFWFGFFLLTRVLRVNWDGFFLICVAVTLICSTALGLRIRKIFSTFTYGQEIPGVIRAVWFQRDRGKIEIKYSYLSQEYQAGSQVIKNKLTSSLYRDQPITVIIDPDHPEQGLIRDLYFNADRVQDGN
jgi:hypothetical protein